MRYIGTGVTLNREDTWRSVATMLGRERIISLIRPDNARSIRVAEGLGETLVGETELLAGKSLVYEVRRKP